MSASATSTVDIGQLYEDLHEIAPKWQTFGVHLGVPYDRLQGLDSDGSLVDRCFTAMLATWLREGGTIEKLIEGLRFPGVDQNRLATEMEKNKDKVKLELPFLLKELECCKASWFHFGVGLGIKDSLLREMEKDRKAPGVLRCLQDTLMLWLSLGEVNINTLVKAVELSGYKILAGTIRSKYEGKRLSTVYM